MQNWPLPFKLCSQLVGALKLAKWLHFFGVSKDHSSTNQLMRQKT